MPLYEYLCNDCQQEFELLIYGDTKAHCEKCGSAKLTKLLSVTAAHSSMSGQSDMPEMCQRMGCPGGDMPDGGMCGMGGCGI